MTNNERAALQGILNSDFMDGAKGQGAVDVRVWTWSANPFPSKRTFSGVVSSLIKKGWVKSTEAGDESTICITAAGMAAFEGQS